MSFDLADYWEFDGGWRPLDKTFRQSARNEIGRLNEFLASERSFDPVPEKIFRAFRSTSLTAVRVVIMGQDPYHDGTANGLAFCGGGRSTPSLRAIYDAIDADDLPDEVSRSFDLQPWTKDGVLLLNTVLTVRRKEPNSHKQRGWEAFTDRVVDVIDQEVRDRPIVFLLWGEKAWAKARRVRSGRHYVLAAAHPQARNDARLALARCRPFSLTNRVLAPRTIRWWQ